VRQPKKIYTTYKNPQNDETVFLRCTPDQSLASHIGQIKDSRSGRASHSRWQTDLMTGDEFMCVGRADHLWCANCVEITRLLRANVFAGFIDAKPSEA
jgi:hypothetical protein